MTYEFVSVRGSMKFQDTLAYGNYLNKDKKIHLK